MLQVSPERQLKYKRRKVSAIRQFPRGCIPNAAKLNPKPADGTLSSVVLENGKVTETDNVLVDSNVAEKPVDSSPSVLEEKALSIPGLSVDLVEVVDLGNTSTTAPLESNSDSIPEMKKKPEAPLESNSDSILEMKKPEAPLESNSESIPEMKKKTEAPLESNSDSIPEMKKKPEAPPESNSDSITETKKEPELQYPIESSTVLENNVENKPGTVKLEEHQLLENSNPKKSEMEVQQVMMESSASHILHDKNFYLKVRVPLRRRKISAIRQFPPGCGPNTGNIKKENCAVPTKKFLHGEEKLPYVKQSTLMDGSTQMKDAEDSLNLVKSTMKQEKTIVGSVKVPSSERIEAADRKEFRVTKEKESAIHESATFRSNSEKSSRIQSGSGHAQVKPSSKNGSNEVLVRSTSSKTLDGYKVDRTFQSSQTKANSSSSSQFGSKLLDKRGTPLLEKPIGKEHEIDQPSSKKRKLQEGSPYKGYSPSEGDDSLDAIGERMIIQALMSGKNCPWRNQKKRTSIISDPVVPKSTIKKEKRFKDKTLASKKYFSSQQKRKDLVEDDDDDDDDTPPKKNKLSITMTPFVPPESSQRGGDSEEVGARHKVKRALRLFQLICRKLLQGEEKTKRMGRNRIDLQSSAMLKDSGEWVNSGEPIIGHVPGVEIGDEFHFRVELSIVGLHRPFQGGIDCTKKNGILLATSIVASGGHQDDMDSSDVLIYSGAGGTSVVGGDKQQGDQKLERGNLALKNSIDMQTPVRVIHGFKEKGSESHDRGKLVSTFTYDGLYHVESYWQEVGNNGFNVFKFQLRRLAHQPELALKVLKRSAKLKNREGLCIKDISQGKEKILISVVNTLDTDQPMPFKYITKSIYPSCYTKAPPRGCDCTNGCSDSDKCACAVKNGGEIPFNFNGAIVQAKPLIYECGPSCKCSPSCHNRVSQRGIRMQLEIFKTTGRGWGVRSLKSIPSGTFICEYVGEMLQDGEAEQRTNDEYLFDIGHNYDDRSLWEGLPNLIPGLQSNSECDTVESVGFTIDAAEFGNVGRFINHSCSPNLYAQNVLYDHDDKRMPHIMFFAVDNIPPLQELTYHYNYTIDEVRDSEGNIKQKACHCGSLECCGRLY